MKKIFTVFFAGLLLIFSVFTASAEYEDVKLKMGLNPIIIKTDDNTFKYVIVAKYMEKMTNGDISVHYDSTRLSVASVEEPGNYDVSVANDTGEKVLFSFMYNDCNMDNELTLLIINFIGNAEESIPKVELTNIAGTYIKKVADPVIIEKKSDGTALIIGDADADGKLTAADARLALRVSAGLETVSSKQYSAADVDSDGKVTAADARRILRASAGLEKLP